MAETLEDHLRRVTRNFTARVPEEQAFAIARDLARALEQAHGETPPRHPALDPDRVDLGDRRPRLRAGARGRRATPPRALPRSTPTASTGWTDVRGSGRARAAATSARTCSSSARSSTGWPP